MKIGIALAAFEPHFQFLGEQLESLILQTHQDWVCHVTFDSPLIQPINDPRIHYHQNDSRLGLAKNFERAMNLCANDVDVRAIAFCDQDDVWDPRKLEVSLKRLVEAPALSLVHCDLLPFTTTTPEPGQNSSLWKLERRRFGPHTAQEQMVRCTVNGNAALFDAELARRFPVFPDSVIHHDQWLTILAAACGGIYEVPEILVHYRQHGSNVSGVNSYEGLLSCPPNLTERIRNRHREFRAIQTALRSLDIPIHSPSKWNLLWMALSRFQSDPVLARASISKLLGSYLGEGRAAE